ADFAPPRRRVPFGLVAILLAVLAVAGAATYFVLNTDFGGGDTPSQAAAPAPLHTAKLIGADDFDPFGSDREEHSYEVRNVYDGDKTTTWSTENYTNAVFPAGKSGVGIFVWSDNAVSARRIDVLTTTPGFTARVYGANRIPSSLPQWGKPLATLKGSGERLHATLPGKRYSRYLVWITKLPAQGQVSIADIRLLE
ncbi:MAG: eukaryotic-like serine/threonine-protein kinase, partial [Thermoleophilaceae bacterium]|nr:eukaryotic-like serine/threonine-protein kinase [Thermoleophilaceae bacterium]